MLPGLHSLSGSAAADGFVAVCVAANPAAIA
eukprot:SAG31_NODE_23387_length_505_cov_1.246305_2_plen_30_part_01